MGSVRLADVRDRLARFLADQPNTTHEIECPMCHGEGRVQRKVKTWRQEDVAKVLGVSRTSVVNFLGGKQDFPFDRVADLIDWLDANERRATPTETPEESEG